MSQIFDALQRSESERSGKSKPAASRATELLQDAENQLASKREPAEHRETSDPFDRVDRHWKEELRAEQPLPAVRVESVATGLLTKSDELERADVFQPLQISPPQQSRLVCLPDSDNPAAEAFHLLGVRLRHLRRERPLKKVLITSSIPQEGKSMVAANLACTLALRTRQRTLLLEGDVRRPTQSKVFGFGRNPGICEWLLGQRSLRSSIYHIESAGLWILPAGIASSDSLELLQSGKLSAMMDQLASWFDWIVIDSPPILPLADTSVWTNLADGILLVTRQGTTEKRRLQKGLEALDSNKLIGAVLNSSTNMSHNDYYYRPSNLNQVDETSTV
ncbi:MAG: CpsD/CapB family tyrosine-protein kinase [Terracidiphilus sp.]